MRAVSGVSACSASGDRLMKEMELPRYEPRADILGGRAVAISSITSNSKWR